MRRRFHSYIDSSTSEDSIIDLTPLIDVVFVVLVAFILIAPMLEFDRIDLAPGDSSLQTVHDKSPISILVKEDNSIWLNQREVHFNELEQGLALANKKAPDKIPQLFHDHRAAFGTYQKIKNAVENAGFKELDVVLKPQ